MCLISHTRPLALPGELSENTGDGLVGRINEPQRAEALLQGDLHHGARPAHPQFDSLKVGIKTVCAHIASAREQADDSLVERVLGDRLTVTTDVAVADVPMNHKDVPRTDGMQERFLPRKRFRQLTHLAAWAHPGALNHTYFNRVK
jgi:hypothetical protein